MASRLPIFAESTRPIVGDQIICQSRLVYERICSERVREGQTVLGRIVEAKQYDLGGRCALIPRQTLSFRTLPAQVASSRWAERLPARISDSAD